MNNRNIKSPKPNIRVGIDFDKVLVNYPPLIPDQFINWIYKKRSKTLKYRFPGKLEQKLRILSHYPLFRHPIVENVSAVKSFYKKKIPVYLISGRFGFLEKRTENWLNIHKLKKYFKEIYFNFENNQPHLFKDKLMKKLKITHFIDDDLDLLMYLAKNNPKIKFYWVDTSRVSKRYIPFENIQKINSVQDIINI